MASQGSHPWQYSPTLPGLESQSLDYKKSCFSWLKAQLEVLWCYNVEDLLAAIAHATGCPMGVAVERMETVRLAGLPERLFTTDMSATHIRYVAWQ